jgi:cell division protein FtsB
MKLFAAALVVVVAFLQYRLWFADGGMRSVISLRKAVAAQVSENQTLSRRNDQLAAEVKDLKEGTAALEERARNDLGMIGSNETFYQVVDPDKNRPGVESKPTPAPAAGVASARDR